MLNVLDAPFFRTPGNHDLANKTAQEVWLNRYGATFYYFVYRDVLFMVLDSEDNSRPAPLPGMKEKIELYNRLQVEDPAKAQAMLGEFMSDEAVSAGLSKPVEFSETQLNWIKETLDEHIDGVEYITMGPTGASFHHEGPGNVDHIMWVTMTENGPQMGNIALKGLFDRKGLDPSMFGAYARKGHQTKEPESQ